MSTFYQNAMLNMETYTYVIVSLIISSVASIVFFLFKAFAIQTMCKKRGIGKRFLAFIPFANFYLLGKLLGKVILFGKSFKNIGLFVAIFSFSIFLLNEFVNFTDLIERYFIITTGSFKKENLIFSTTFFRDWYNYVGFGGVFRIILSVLSRIMSIANIVFEVTLIFLIFKKYCPERSLIYSLISVFVDGLFGIFLFVIRNNEPVNYSDYVSRQRQRYYQDYQNYQNYQNHQQNNQNEDPFGNRFGGTNEQNRDNPFPEYDNTINKNNDKDDLFN